MKNFTFFFLRKAGVVSAMLLFLTTYLQAQVSGYSFNQSAGTYTEIIGSLVATQTGSSGAASLDDVIYTGADGTIPFPFTFNGNSYTGLRVSTNGFITFGATAPSTTTYTPISATTGYAGAISAFSRDLQGGYVTTGTTTLGSNVITSAVNTSGIPVGAIISGTGIPAGTTVTAVTANTITMSANASSTGSNRSIYAWTGEIRVDVVGTAPNRSFVVQWKNFKPFGTSATAQNFRIDFQIWLNEDNSVNVVYRNALANSSSITPQVGLRGATNADFNNRTGSNWPASAAGVANNATMTYSTAATLPTDGLTYSWSLPPCMGTPNPGNTLSSLNPACAGRDFTLSLANATPGTGVTYQWQSSTDGQSWEDIPNATGSTYTTSQTSATWYQCVVTCDPEQTSGTSTPLFLDMNLPINCHCAAGATNTSFEKISNVTFNTINNSSSSTAGYENFTNISTTVARNASYPISVSISGAYPADQVIVWIDFNQDGDYDDAGEEVYQSAQGVGPHTGTIQIPCTASLGLTRMRIRMHDASLGPNITPCGNSSYGQVEDYSLMINPAVYVGNVTFTTQAQLNAWSSCYQGIQGNLTISGAGINNLGPLANIEFVTGSVSIQYTLVTSMNGLNSLTSVGQNLIISYNQQLTTLAGLNNLANVGMNLLVLFNTKLSDCCAIQDLVNEVNGKNVGGLINIAGNKTGCESIAGINTACNAPLIGAAGGNNFAINNTEIQGILLFPNPASGEVNVAIRNSFETGSIRLLDLQGRVLRQQDLEGGAQNYQISLDHLPAGTYFVLTMLDGEVFSEKLSVK